MKIVVINLAADQARWAEVRRQFEQLGLPVERFQAVVGRDLTDAQTRAALQPDAERAPVPQAAAAG